MVHPGPSLETCAAGGEPAPARAERLKMGDYARHVGRLAVRLAQESAGLAEGVWNPAYCASDAAPASRVLCRDLRDAIDHLESLAERSDAAPVDEQRTGMNNPVEGEG